MGIRKQASLPAFLFIITRINVYFPFRITFFSFPTLFYPLQLPTSPAAPPEGLEAGDGSAPCQAVPGAVPTVSVKESRRMLFDSFEALLRDLSCGAFPAAWKQPGPQTVLTSGMENIARARPWAVGPFPDSSGEALRSGTDAATIDPHEQ